MAQTRNSKDRYNIRVLDRAVDVLSALSDGKQHSLTGLSEAVNLSSSTTFRILSTLHCHGYVERDERSGAYKLGLACLELARAYGESNDIRVTALPDLEMLRDDTKETVHLAVLDRHEVVYLDKLPGLHAVGIMSSQIGRRAASHCTGLGKALLAFEDIEEVRAYFQRKGLRQFTDATIQSVDELIGQLQQIRKRGYSFDLGEHEQEVRCVAAPVFDISGRAVAAISVSGPSSRLDPLEEKRELIDRTLESAHSISAKLGYRGKSQFRDSSNQSISGPVTASRAESGGVV